MYKKVSKKNVKICLQNFIINFFKNFFKMCFFFKFTKWREKFIGEIRNCILMKNSVQTDESNQARSLIKILEH